MLLLAGVVGYGVWDFRRKSAAREAASKARFEGMFTGQDADAPANPKSAPPPPVVAPAAIPAPPPPLPAVDVSASGRFLDQTGTLVYRLLKAGLPDHEIFAGVALSSVVSASGKGSQGEQQARRLSLYRLDFVICDRDLRVVAAVEVEAGAGADAIGMRRFREDCLKAAGVRLVRLDASALPRRQDIRPLLGAGPQPPSEH
jgi:hypothetical protein